MKRYAIITGARSRSEAEAYLPDNYRITWEGDVPAYEGAKHNVSGFVIEGEDNAGWTLDDYVIPRYASGLIGCTEIDLSHPVMKQVPSTPPFSMFAFNIYRNGELIEENITANDEKDALAIYADETGIPGPIKSDGEGMYVSEGSARYRARNELLDL